MKLSESVLLVAIAAVFVPAFCAAQTGPPDPGRGILMNSTNEFGVDLATSFVHMQIPFRLKAGKIPFTSGWTATNGMYFQTVTGGYQITTTIPSYYDPTAGASISATLTSGTCRQSTATYDKYTNFSVVDITGATHPLPTEILTVSSDPNCQVNGLTTAATTDGSGYTFVPAGGQSVYSTVYDKAGMSWPGNYGVHLANAVTDPDGASITVGGTGYTGWAPVTDSLGVNVLTANVSGGFVTSYSYTDESGTQYYTPTSAAISGLKTNFHCQYLADEYFPGGSLLTTLTIPTGDKYRFSWEPTPGSSGYYTGRIAQITFPTGGSISYSYWDPYGNNGINCASGMVPKLTVTVNDNNGNSNQYTYINNKGAASNYTVVKTDPAGNQTVYSFSGEYQTQAATYEGGCPTTTSGCNGGGALQRTTTTCYNASFSNCVSPSAVPTLPILQTDVYTSINGSSSVLAETKYDSYGNIIEVKQYNYGAATPPSGNPLSDTTITHAGVNGVSCGSVALYQYDRPCSITTFNSSGSSMTQVSQVNYTYANGHPTQTSTWVSGSNYLNASASYNGNGTISTATDIQGTVSTYAYNGTGGCNGLLPTSITAGGLTTSTQWDCNGGVPTQTKDYNQQPTTYAYNDPLWRVSSITDPLMNVTNFIYGTNSVERTFSFGSSSQDTKTTVDGLGRTIRTQTKHGSAYDTVTTKYNAVADTVSASIPCSAALGGDCTTGFTVVTNDAVGRTSSIVDGGGATLATTFSAQDTISTLSPHPGTENNKIVQSEIDGLGRMVSTCSILSSGGSACGQVAGGSGIATTFGYSTATGSSTTTATRGVQTRTTVKDAIGRVISQTDPERGTTQYIYDYYAPTACGNPANLPGRLYVVALPSLNEKCFEYDTLGRMTDMGENLANNSAFVCTRFRFDTSSKGIFTAPGTISNGVGRIVEAETDDCTVYPPTAGHWFSDEWFSYDAVGHVTDVWEATAHSSGYYHSTATYFANAQLASLGIPGLGTVTYTIDGDGKPQTATLGRTLVNGVTYGPTGPTTIKVGASTDKDVYGHSATTGKPTSYQFSVGAASNTGTLNWNTNGTLGSLVIADGFNSADNETCTSIYDDLARLTSDQCGSPWAQTYSYGMYDNLNQFGSSPFTYTYNAANNHYSTSGVTYDADGDLTYDGVNNYTYNASDKLWSVYPTGTSCTSSGSANCYIYDAFGHMVERESGGSYTQTLYGPNGQKLAGMSGQTLSYAFIPTPGGSRVLTSGASTFYYLHLDWLGSARTASTIPTSGTGTVFFDRQFAPFSQMYGNSGSAGTGSQIFTGDTHQAVGLFDTTNRELNQSQGRWLTPDPARSGWNLYGYSTNPNSEIDPSGLIRLDWTSTDPGERYTGGCNATIDGGSDVPCALVWGTGSLSTQFNLALCAGGCGTHYDWQWKIPTIGAECDNWGCGSPYLKDPGGWQLVGSDVFAANNGPVDWVIEDYSLLRLKQTWWKWGLGYGAKVGAVKLFNISGTTVGYLGGLSTLMMLGSTMIDATSPGMPLAPGPPQTDPCMGQALGLNWVPGPNGTTVGVPACQ